MATTVNNNNIESNNGMSQVVIDLRPEVKHLESYGHEKVADVYFRTSVRAYSRQVCGDYSQEAHEAAEKATAAYYSEVVELLKGEGWTLLKDYVKWDRCPELTKGAQYLYVHPDSISGEVNPADIETLEAKFKAMTTCEYHCTDNYGDIILTSSETDERLLYRATYAEGIAVTIKECTTTKRSNLYKDKGDALGCIRNRIAIRNKRTDLTGHGTGYYRERKAVAGFVQEEYDRLLKAGYIKEATGQNGRTLCRWISKKEEKELNKARREAEKAAKDREAATLEPASEITEQREQNDACISSAESRRDKANGQITDVPAADLVWDEDEQGVKVWGNIDKHAENLTKMGAKRGRVVFKSNKTGLPTGADCWVLPKSKCEDVRQYVRKVHERISRDFSEAREKYGDKGHKYHDGEKVVTIYGRGTVVCGRAWYASDLIDVQLDLPTYNYIYSLLGTPQKMVAVSRDNIVSIELPEPPKEIIIDEEPTLESASEIKAVCIEGVSLTAEKRAKWVKNFGDIIREHTTQGRETQYNHDCGCIRVNVAYRNESDKPEEWTYCVAWYKWLDIVTEKRELVECENGVRLEQAARAMADFHLLADAGLTLQQILYPAA